MHYYMLLPPAELQYPTSTPSTQTAGEPPEWVKITWSNGQAEGQITKLKMMKRQMYGRANFDLLRRRILLAA